MDPIHIVIAIAVPFVIVSGIAAYKQTKPVDDLKLNLFNGSLELEWALFMKGYKLHGKVRDHNVIYFMRKTVPWGKGTTMAYVQCPVKNGFVIESDGSEKIDIMPRRIREKIDVQNEEWHIVGYSEDVWWEYLGTGMGKGIGLGLHLKPGIALSRNTKHWSDPAYIEKDFDALFELANHIT